MPVTVPSMETVSFAAELTFGHFGSSSVMTLEFSALKFIAHTFFGQATYQIINVVKLNNY
jgi:hypothetical protein